LAKRLLILAAVVCLCLPGAARANGDPASDYLLVQSVFLPFNAKIDPNVLARLSDTVRAADKAGYKVKIALIGSRYDLGTAFSLYREPARYAEFLGLELSFQFRGHLLVVMPNGFGVSTVGKPDPRGTKALKGLAGPGKDATRQAEAATTAIRRLAAASGHVLTASGAGSASSPTRDRLTIAAAVTALVALLAAIVFIRRRPRASAD
jgi:hypothetical protein